MPTNDERRAVAARLRWLTMAYKDVFGVYVLNAIGLDFTNSRGTYCSNDSVRRLADLIEPEPEERTCHNLGTYGGFECSMCGFKEKQLSEMECEPQDWCFCPNCGAKVVEQ